METYVKLRYDLDFSNSNSRLTLFCTITNQEIFLKNCWGALVWKQILTIWTPWQCFNKKGHYNWVSGEVLHFPFNVLSNATEPPLKHVLPAECHD